LWAVIVGRVLIIKSFQLQLQLSFTLASSFNLCTLSGQAGLFLLFFFLSTSSALLFFRLLEFALLHLLFQSPESSLRSLTLLR
jgi:hypothetical protein